MAGTLNKVMLIGHLGRDPEIRYLPSGQANATFSMATTETWAGKDGQKESRTEWHRIVAWGKLAEICGQYLAKGKLIYIEGRIQTREWEDRDGNKRTTTEIVANQMQMLGAKDSQGQQGQQTQPPAAPRPAAAQTSRPAPQEIPEPPYPDTNEDDIPF